MPVPAMADRSRQRHRGSTPPLSATAADASRRSGHTVAPRSAVAAVAGCVAGATAAPVAVPAFAPGVRRRHIDDPTGGRGLTGRDFGGVRSPHE